MTCWQKLFSLVLLAALALPVPAASAQGKNGAPDIHMKSHGWTVVERRVGGARGSASYETKIHTQLDLVNIALLHPEAPIFLPNEWMDFSAGENALFAKYTGWIKEYVAERTRLENADAFNTEPRMGPIRIKEFFQSCEIQGGAHTRSGRRTIAGCMIKKIFGKAVLRLTVMIDKKNVEKGDSSGNRVDISHFSAVRIKDKATGDAVDLAVLPKRKSCSKSPQFEICSSCQRSYADLAAGKAGRAACRDGDGIIFVNAGFSYAKFAALMMNAKDPRLSLLLAQDEKGKTYALDYKLENFLEAIIWKKPL